MGYIFLPTGAKSRLAVSIGYAWIPDQAAHLRKTEAGPCPTRVEGSGVAMNRGALRETTTAPARDRIL
jgi:hypothetical protein